MITRLQSFLLIAMVLVELVALVGCTIVVLVIGGRVLWAIGQVLMDSAARM